MPKMIVIDAKGKSLGRVASAAATALRGKNLPDFQYNKLSGAEVRVENAAAIKITGKKLTQKIYKRTSSYPGGLTEEVMERVLARKGPEELVRHAVRGMLPKNRLQGRMLKNLSVTR